MGVGDVLSTIGSGAKDFGRTLYHTVVPAHPSGPPGTLSGPPPVPARLVHNADGSATDPVTGQVYVSNGAGGLVAAGAPNLAQQSGTATERAAGFFAREPATFGREQSLADTLTALAAGRGPSLAGTQGAITLDQGQRQQLAQAAGASGDNAALARMNAMGNTGALAANAGQTAVLGRTNEELGALGQLGSVTGAMENQTLGAGAAAAGLGMQGMSEQERLQYEASKAAADAYNQKSHDLANAISGLATGKAKLG